MFIMDMPYVPVQDAPIVLVQAATVGATPQPDYILNDCQGTASGEQFKGTAIRVIDPGYALANALNKLAGKSVVNNLSMIKNITLLESVKHGKLVEETDNEGLISYYYDPVTNYVGNDRAVFMAEFQGKHYKIVINLKVSPGLNNDLCPAPLDPKSPYKLIKVKKAVTGQNGFDLNAMRFTDL